MSIHIEETSLPDVKVYTPTKFEDERGFFFESFNQKHFEGYTFVQDNHSWSFKDVVRGLHYQLVKPQGKLVRVISGAIFDVAVDIRKSSPQFGKWVAVELSAVNAKQLWIPPGFAHGFMALENNTQVLYKTTEYWFKEHERSIHWNDPALNIEWPSQGVAKLSLKDSEAPDLQTAELFE
jgi:dTDP-4-dehydrorhamnose 3,5-epimerase